MNKNLSSLDADELKIKNRINLLKNEEKRILKKIEQDRDRAEKIKKIQEVVCVNDKSVQLTHCCNYASKE